MSYSFTEKKRIRKSFASRPSVLEVPSLLETQLRSYEDFLQDNVPPAARNKDVGLQAAFTSIFPILSNNGYACLKFEDYTLAEPEFRRRRVPAARSHLQQPPAREDPPRDLRP